MESEVTVQAGNDYLLHFHAVEEDAEFRSTVVKSVKGLANSFAASTGDEYQCGQRRRQISESSTTSSLSSNDSYCIEKREMALHFTEGDDQFGHSLCRVIETEKPNSVHTNLSIPSGKQFYGGLLKIGRRVDLNVFIITDIFILKVQQFECMIQPRVCNKNNTLLLLQKGVTLPPLWGHFPSLRYDTSFDVQDLALRIMQYRTNKRRETTVRVCPVLGAESDDKIFVVNGILCYIASGIQNGSGCEAMKNLVANKKATLEMVKKALGTLLHSDLTLPSPREYEQLHMGREVTREELLDKVFDGVEETMRRDKGLRFVADDMSIFCSSEGDETCPPSSQECQTALDESVSSKQMKPTERQLLSKKHASKRSAQRMPLASAPPLPTIRESSRVQHFLVKKLPPKWKLEDAENCTLNINSSLQSITRVSRYENDTPTSMKIAVREDMVTVKKACSWPKGAKIVRFYFWRKQ